MGKEQLSEQIKHNKPLITKSELKKRNPEPAPKPVLPDKKERTPGQIQLND